MADQISNSVFVRLGEKLDCLSLRSSDSLIFKVPHQLYRINEKAYEPQIISIGPYHRGKQHLKAMEIHKLHYLKTFLGRNENLLIYVNAMRAMEDEARKCYEQTANNVRSDDFVEMMIIDGCFIVELIWRWKEQAMREKDDELFTVDWIMVKISHDLLLLENQLPFFVLLELFSMSYKNVIPYQHFQEIYFIHMALSFLAPIVPGPGIQYEQHGSVEDIKHLLDLVHKSWVPSPQGMERYREQQQRDENICSASELREAGVIFKKITVNKFKRVEVEGDSLFDIRFENGRMMIPKLCVYNDTERFFGNLMTYERFMIGRPNYVTDYVLFMHSLINSGKDVEILCRRGIIKHWLGDDEVVATMFNKLRDLIFSSDDNFYYSKALDDINRHCQNPYNIWKAKIMKNFDPDNPWQLINLYATFYTLLFTLLQTIYSVLSYSK